MDLMVTGQPTIVGWHSGGINRNIIEFFGEAPEPGEMVLLGVGVGCSGAVTGGHRAPTSFAFGVSANCQDFACWMI